MPKDYDAHFYTFRGIHSINEKKKKITVES